MLSIEDTQRVNSLYAIIGTDNINEAEADLRLLNKCENMLSYSKTHKTPEQRNFLVIGDIPIRRQ